MSVEDGKWNDWRGSDTMGSTIRVGPIFSANIVHACVNGCYRWQCSLDGGDMGCYPTLGGAKARLDWEMWNRVRLARPGFKILLSRREEWKDAGNAYRSPEYFGLR